MRTTLTLDDDVAAKLKAEARRSGAPLKQVVNDTLRRGLNQPQTQASLPPFEIKARPLGERPGLNYDCVWRLLEEVEGPDYR